MDMIKLPPAIEGEALSKSDSQIQIQLKYHKALCEEMIGPLLEQLIYRNPGAVGSMESSSSVIEMSLENDPAESEQSQASRKLKQCSMSSIALQ